MITQSDMVLSRRVPWLSDIPVIGHLFRFDGKTCKRAELLIILTPHVVKDQDEAERLKRIEAARMHWCLADVNQLHGDTGLVNIQEVSDLTDGNAKTIYPDADPAGLGLEPPADGKWDDVEVIPTRRRNAQRSLTEGHHDQRLSPNRLGKQLSTLRPYLGAASARPPPVRMPQVFL